MGELTHAQPHALARLPGDVRAWVGCVGVCVGAGGASWAWVGSVGVCVGAGGVAWVGSVGAGGVARVWVSVWVLTLRIFSFPF